MSTRSVNTNVPPPPPVPVPPPPPPPVAGGSPSTGLYQGDHLTPLGVCVEIVSFFQRYHDFLRKTRVEGQTVNPLMYLRESAEAAVKRYAPQLVNKDGSITVPTNPRKIDTTPKPDHPSGPPPIPTPDFDSFMRRSHEDYDPEYIGEVRK